MRSFPDISANMPSLVDYEQMAWGEVYDDYNSLIAELGIGSGHLNAETLFDNIEPLYRNFDDYGLDDNEVRRDCLLGKTPDDCLRDCGQECDSALVQGYHRDTSCKVINSSPVPPYSPYNDHCYYQTIGYPNPAEAVMPNDSLESESQSDGSSSADEIDVVTLPKVETPVALPKKRGRKPGQKLKPSNRKSPLKKQAAIKRADTHSIILPQARPAKRQKRGESGGSRSCSDAEGADKRNEHNDLERQRRNLLKTKLQKLRAIVPAIENNLKAPKVMILNEALKFCKELTAQCTQYENVIRTEKRLRDEQHKKLKQLKSRRLQ